MGGSVSANVVGVVLCVVTNAPCAASGSATRRLRSNSEVVSLQPGGLVVGSEPTQAERMNHLAKTLSNFQSFAEKSSKKVADEHQKEDKELQKYIAETTDESAKLALTQSQTSNLQSMSEISKIYKTMVNFSESVMGLLNMHSSDGGGCQLLHCGIHASCTETVAGAECVCNEGYVGIGKDCRPPPEFMPHSLLYEGGVVTGTKTADMHVDVFDTDKIAVVFRDESKAHTGRIIVGAVREAGIADLAPPLQFSAKGGRAFSPVVAGTSNKRLAVAWRDNDKNGNCWMIGAKMGKQDGRGSDLALQWGPVVNFCKAQSHKMAIMSFPEDRVVVLFADQTKTVNGVDHTGSAFDVQVTETGELNQRGTFHFSDYPVCRLEVVKVSSNSFVVAARAGAVTDDLTNVTTKQEALAIYGEMVGEDLVFNPHPVSIEPTKEHIWARGISVISQNTVAYAYEDGDTKTVMLAVLEINPENHHMTIADGPKQIITGYSPYVSMISVPYAADDPHTLTYYQSETASMINVCSWSSSFKRISRCEDFTWLAEKTKSISGARFANGSSFMVFTPENGLPYYGVFGLSKK